jgi:molecular chaperone GrpE
MNTTNPHDNEDSFEVDTVSDDDITIEEDDGNTQATINKLRTRLKQSETERQQYLDGWQRMKADFVNAQRIAEEDRKKILKFAKEDVLQELLPVLDSFEMAFSHKESWEKADKVWRDGMERVHNQLLSILSANGLEEFNPLGETFDPAAHIAVQSVPARAAADDHTVMAVLQKGYRLNGKVVRPAKVAVGVFEQ